MSKDFWFWELMAEYALTIAYLLWAGWYATRPPSRGEKQ